MGGAGMPNENPKGKRRGNILSSRKLLNLLAVQVGQNGTSPRKSLAGKSETDDGSN